MAVAITYPKTFLSEFVFFERKWIANLKDYLLFF